MSSRGGEAHDGRERHGGLFCDEGVQVRERGKEYARGRCLYRPKHWPGPIGWLSFRVHGCAAHLCPGISLSRASNQPSEFSSRAGLYKSIDFHCLSRICPTTPSPDYQQNTVDMAALASKLLPGKVVAITGCSTGIGRAVAIGVFASALTPSLTRAVYCLHLNHPHLTQA